MFGGHLLENFLTTSEKKVVATFISDQSKMSLRPKLRRFYDVFATSLHRLQKDMAFINSRSLLLAKDMFFWKQKFDVKQLKMNKFINSTIMNKINVTLLQSPLLPPSMLINEWLRKREAEFSTKAPTTTNLQHWIRGKGGSGNIKSRIFTVTLSFVQDCLKIHEYSVCYIFKDWD